MQCSSSLIRYNFFLISDKNCHRQRLKVGWKCRRKNLNGHLCLMGEKSRGLSTLIVSDMHRAASATSRAGKVNRAAPRLRLEKQYESH